MVGLNKVFLIVKLIFAMANGASNGKVFVKVELIQ